MIQNMQDKQTPLLFLLLIFEHPTFNYTGSLYGNATKDTNSS